MATDDALALAQKARRVAQHLADEQERVHFAMDVGCAHALEFAPDVQQLVDDSDGEVRYYALQVLVLDLGIADETMAGLVFRALEKDPDEFVRGMAASCVGSIYFDSKKGDIFARLREILEQELSDHVQLSIYNALHLVVGLPPSEWPLHKDIFTSSESIDWSRVVELERLVS